MTRSIFVSITFHFLVIYLAALSLPFITKKAIDLPPIISVELIQISDTTNIPYAPKAREILEKIKKKIKELFLNKLPLLQNQKKNLTKFLYQKM